MLKIVFVVLFISLSGFSQRADLDQKFSNYLRSTEQLPLSKCSFINGKYSRDRFSREAEVVVNCSNKLDVCDIQLPNGRRVVSSDRADRNGVALNLACVKDNSIYTKLLFSEKSQYNSYIQSMHLESVVGVRSQVLVLQDLQQQKSFLYFKIEN